MLKASVGLGWGLSVIQKLLFKRPILVGGLGLAASLSLIGGLQEVFADSTTLAGLIATGVGVWWWRHQRPAAAPSSLKPMTPVERQSVEAALATVAASLETLQQELVTVGSTDSAMISDCLYTLQKRHQTLIQDLDRSHLNVAIVGAPRTGKSTLATQLQAAPLRSSAGSEERHLSEELHLIEVALATQMSPSDDLATQVEGQDAILYLVTEDLTESVLADLKTLAASGQRVLLALNKQDQYLPQDRGAILKQVKWRLQSLPQTVEAVAIATAPQPIKVRTHSPDGQAHERVEPQAPAIEPVINVVTAWLAQEVPHLVTQTVMRQTQQLRQDIQQAFNQVRREKVWPVVEQLQWTAAATAFASPVPSLDLLATIAINGQLVMDLGRVYQQPISLEQAQTVAAELAAIVVKLGVVEVSTQLLTTTLKSHAATYVVGGGVQAFSAAYLTRLSGESLMAYFEERALTGQAEKAVSADVISQKLKALVPSTQRTEFLQNLVKQGVQKLTPKNTSANTLALAPGTKPTVKLEPNSVVMATAKSETSPPEELV